MKAFEERKSNVPEAFVREVYEVQKGEWKMVARSETNAFYIIIEDIEKETKK